MKGAGLALPLIFSFPASLVSLIYKVWRYRALENFCMKILKSGTRHHKIIYGPYNKDPMPSGINRDQITQDAAN